MRKASIDEVSFIAAVVLVTTAFTWLLVPDYGAVLWATIIALPFYPLHRTLQHRFGGRRNLAAAVSVLCFICIVLIPDRSFSGRSPMKPHGFTGASANASSTPS